MKKTFKTMLALMAGAMVFTACSSDDEFENINEPRSPFHKMTFFASQEGQSGATRAAIDGTLIKWVAGDKITIFDGVKDNEGSFAREFTLSSGEGTTSASFTGEAADANIYYALYPSVVSTLKEITLKTDEEVAKAIGSSKFVMEMLRAVFMYNQSNFKEEAIGWGISTDFHDKLGTYFQSGNFIHAEKTGVQRNSSDQFEDVVIPSDQSATAGSADPKAMLMIGKSDDKTSLEFKNVCAYIKVTPSFACKAIYLKSNGSEKLAGTVTVDYNSGEPTTTVTANGSNEIRLTGTITADNTYYIAVRPETLTSGFTITFVTTDAKLYKKSTTKAFTIARNKVVDLGSFDASDLTPVPITTGTAEATISSITVDVPWVQLWEDGPKWAIYNVGVTKVKVESYGGNYTWANNIAQTQWGDKWRMPTSDELEALINSENCTVEWTTVGGVSGCKFTGKAEPYSFNSVFLPAAGYCIDGVVYAQGYVGSYWSSTPDGSDFAYHLNFGQGSQSVGNYSLRNRGYSVRAVLAE